jgi:hypothetical protein
MTRKGFMLRLAGMLGLAGVAMGQEHKPSIGELRDTNGIGGGVDMWDGKRWVWKSVEELEKMSKVEELKPGEEYCSLGHAQKPRTQEYADGSRGTALITVFDEGKLDFVVHVCCVCGVVYVPQEKK